MSSETQIVEDMLRDYLAMKSLADDTAARANEKKAEIIDVVHALGYEDDKGHIWLELDSQVGDYRAVQYQKRITKSLNQNVAEDVLNELGLYDECIKMVPTLDEDAIMAALYEGRLTEEHIDSMFPSKVVWAFVLSKK